jgi:hypothetical protein
MQQGYDIFYKTPGETDTVYCRICGALCDVKRDYFGPAGFEMAIAEISDLYDVFTCPHTGEKWHDKAVKLVLAIEETPSKRLADLMRLDLEELIKESGVR